MSPASQRGGMVVLEVPDGNANPALRAKLPCPTLGVSDAENPKMARIVGVGFHSVNVAGDLG